MCLEGLRKFMKTSKRIAGVGAEFRKLDIPKMNCYPLDLAGS
jgi:hypothetical protein